jgi:hypothetical protein
MIDTTLAIQYLKDLIHVIEEDQQKNKDAEKWIDAQKRKFLLEKEALIDEKSAFYAQTDTLTQKITQAEKMKDLAAKMKLQVDEDRAEVEVLRKEIEKREKAAEGLEVQKKELEKKELLLRQKWVEMEEREELALKDKLAARNKQDDLTLQATALKKKQERLQQMIDANQT